MYTIIRYYMIINTPNGQNFYLRAIRYNGVDEQKEKKIVMRLEAKGYTCEVCHYGTRIVYCAVCEGQVTRRYLHGNYSGIYCCSQACWRVWLDGQEEYYDPAPEYDGDY